MFRQKEGHQTHYLKFILFYAVLFVGSINFSILYAALWPYISSEHINMAPHKYQFLVLSFSVSVYAAGELLSMPCFHASAASIRIKYVLLVSFGITCLGGLAYSSIPVWQGLREMPFWWVLMIARFVSGFGRGGESAGTRSFAGRYTPALEREKYLFRMRVVASLGMVAGPGIGAMFHFLKENVSMGKGRYGHLDELTCPGYLQAFFAVFSFVLWMVFFTERRQVYQFGSMEASRSVLSSAQQSRRSSKQTKVPLMIAVLLCFGFFVNNLTFVVNETVATPLMIEKFNFKPVQANLVFLGIGGVNLVVTLLLELVGKHLGARWLIIIGLFFQVGGSLAMVDWSSYSLVHFLLGFGALNFGFPIARLALFYQASVWVKHANNNSLLTWMIFSGVLSQVVLPHWTVSAYFLLGPVYKLAILFTVNASILALTAMMFALAHCSLDPSAESYILKSTENNQSKNDKSVDFLVDRDFPSITEAHYSTDSLLSV